MHQKINAFFRNLKFGFAALATAAAVLGAPLATQAAGRAFSEIIVLGDSLSDTGNFHALSGGIPPAPYFEGRFSNGELWVEYLARSLGMIIAAENNYAVGGATTGFFNSNHGVAGRTYSGLQQQVIDLLVDHPEGLDSNALYILWAGANDFFVVLESGGNPVEMIGSGVVNTVQTIQTLWLAGARHILVANIPDLGLTPNALASGFGPVITQLSAAYNQALGGALEALKSAGIDTIAVDAFGTLQGMVNEAPTFGFENVTQPFLSVLAGDVDTFLFWDAVHPTTRGHEVLGASAVTAVIDHFHPGNGEGLPKARVNALNGLARASHLH